MNYKPSLIFALFTIVISVLVSFCLHLFTCNNDEILVAESEQLFNEFKMTKELKKKGEFILNQLTKNVDSLQNELNHSNNNELRYNLMKQIDIAQKEVIDFNSEFVRQQTSIIWGRINNYVEAYGKEKKCSVIVGCQKSSNLFYAEESKDVTADLLDFINRRYEGNN